jgi:hypothetical protein
MNPMQRKVWVLPVELCDRIRAWQEERGISSEVEAARRLLNAALQVNDTVETLYLKIQDSLRVERNIRSAARDVLATHMLVTEIRFAETDVTFKLKSGAIGSVNQDGTIVREEKP